jgi:HPt (histidine-containing phosphotransfer) domain-containing protein
VTAQDAATVRRLAHTLKGNLRALHAHEPLVAASLEEDAAKGDLSRAESLLIDVVAQLDAVNEELLDHVRQAASRSGK